jgi:hypothetical protein
MFCDFKYPVRIVPDYAAQENTYIPVIINLLLICK